MMKRLLAKKWFRITVRVSVGLLSLLVLAWLWLNWWAASRKRLAIEEANKAGLSIRLEDFTKDMPPPEENFARQGLFKQWEDAYQNGWPGEAASSTSPQALYDSLGDEVFGRAFVRGERGKPKTVDFSLLPEGGPYGQTAESFLAEYDRRYRAVLEDLQTGFVLPHVRRPFLPENFSGDAADLPSLSETFGLKLRRVADGMSLRAEAALLTGNSAKAAESIEVMVRLAEAVGSRGMLVSSLVEIVVIRTASATLRRGIERHLWTVQDLERIATALGRLDLRKSMLRAIKSEILMIHMVDGQKGGKGRQEIVDLSMTDAQNGRWDLLGWVVAKKPRWLPDAIFDLNQVDILDNTRRAAVVIEARELGEDWWKEAEAQFQARDHRRGAQGKLIWAYPAAASGLRTTAKAMVEVRMALLACELEASYLRDGAYPVTLEALGSEISEDPFNGKPFRYQVLPESFKLYSLGPDGVDDGGERKLPFQEPTDWIW